MGKSRISYIDSAKGLCMLLVVMIHTGVPEPLPGIYAVKVALFFLLSGYFYSDEMPFAAFLKKKARTLLLPFVVFYGLSYLGFYVLMALWPSFSSYTDAQGIADCFTQKQYFNGPLWFLLSLFEVQLFVFAIRRLFKKCVWASWFGYIVLYAVGYSLSLLNLDLPLNIDSAMVCTIFFAFGMELKRWNLFGRFSRWGSLIVALILYGIFILHPVACWMSVNRYQCNNGLELFVMLSILCMAVVLACKAITPPRNFGFLQFVGRHTLYILCMHHLVYRPIKLVCSFCPISSEIIINCLVFVLTMTFCLVTAPWFELNFPWALGLKRKK